MKTFKIPVEWSIYGEVEVQANDINEALKIAKDNVEDFDFPTENFYIEGSFKINDDIVLIKAMNNL